LLFDICHSQRCQPDVQHNARLRAPSKGEFQQAQQRPKPLPSKLHPIEVRRTGDFDGAFRRASDLHADALYVVSLRHTVLNLPLIVEFATKDRVPLAGGWGDWAKAGGLLSYPELWVIRGVVN
jgi:hypothetical protein